MIKHIKSTNVPVTDQDRALGFYTGVLGFDVRQDAPYTQGTRWIELAIPGAQTTVVFSRRADTAPGEAPALVLIVDDVTAVADALRARGAEIAAEPQSAPWDPQTVWCWLRDTEGNIVMIENR